MIAIQETATSIQTKTFCDDVVRVMSEQKGQIISFVDNTSYGDAYQNQQRELQHTRVCTGGNGEIDYEEMPDLFVE